MPTLHWCSVLGQKMDRAHMLRPAHVLHPGQLWCHAGFRVSFLYTVLQPVPGHKQIMSVKKLNSPEFQYLSGLIRHVIVKRTPCREREVSLGRFSDKRPLAPACNAGSQPGR